MKHDMSKRLRVLDVTDVSPTLWLSMKVVISTSTLQTEMFWWTFATWNPHLLSFAGYSKWCIHGFFREAVLTKWQGLVGILRTAVCRMWWRCFLWSGAGVTMQWWKWYLCRKQSFDDGSVSPLPKRRRVGKSCQTTGMPLSHVNEADSSGPEAHQPARPKGRASDVFWRSSEHVVRSLFFGSAEESLLQCPQGTWRLFALLLSRCQSAFHRELPPVTWCKMRKQEHCGKAICWICDRIIGPII